MAAAICVIVTAVGFARVAAFSTPAEDTLAITASLLVISFTSVVYVILFLLARKERTNERPLAERPRCSFAPSSHL